MAKFKNIKRTSPTPIVNQAPVPKPVKPLAGPIKELKKPELTVKKSVPSASREESRSVEVRVKDSAAKKNGLKPKKIGTFMMIIFVTIILQVILLVSLLYLSPRLIH